MNDRNGDAALYGESFADIYDQWYGDVSDVDATVEVMRDLALGGPVLELGVGTGRLAIPLVEAGVAVTGIDASPAMLDRLEENDPEGRVRRIQADMSDFTLDSSFTAAFVAYNTLFNLTTAEAQRRCFECVAAALEPGGRFVVEAFVPDTDADGPRRNVSPHLREDGTVVLTATVRDDDATVQGQHIELRPDGGVRLRPWRIRYSTPAELDTMAASVGFELEHRWNDWDRSPMDDSSIRHVSVYRLPAPSTDDPTS